MANQKRGAKPKKPARKKPCPARSQGIEYIDYKNLTFIKQFLNERGKIKPRRTTGASQDVQRQIALAVKNAREMALLPYTNR